MTKSNTMLRIAQPPHCRLEGLHFAICSVAINLQNRTRATVSARVFFTY